MKILKILLLLCFGGMIAQAQSLKFPAGGSNKAIISEQIGVTDITIQYGRPGVKGREGKIWGQLVPYGFTDLGFGHRKPAPWRAGANDNTTIEFSTDVKVEGKDLAKGKYGLHIAVNENESILIFSKNSSSWGSFTYEESEDALRVNIKNERTEQSVEWLKYEFLNPTNNSTTIALFWEKMKFAFKVEVDVHKEVIAGFRLDLRNQAGFNWQNLNQAAFYCLSNNVNLEEALTWAEQSVSAPFIGDANFQTLNTKAQLQTKLNKTAEAEATMKIALEKGNSQQLHGYGRQLLNQKKAPQALEIFKLNATKHKNAWPTQVGLMRGYSAVGDFKNALKHGKLALAEAPDQLNKDNLAKMIKTLEAGKDCNAN
jgi:tetratricopeptide (TPR) repeat protein